MFNCGIAEIATEILIGDICVFLRINIWNGRDINNISICSIFNLINVQEKYFKFFLWEVLLCSHVVGLFSTSQNTSRNKWEGLLSLSRNYRSWYSINHWEKETFIFMPQWANYTINTVTPQLWQITIIYQNRKRTDDRHDPSSLFIFLTILCHILVLKKPQTIPRAHYFYKKTLLGFPFTPIELSSFEPCDEPPITISTQLNVL